MEVSSGYLFKKIEAKAIVHAHSPHATAVSAHGKPIHISLYDSFGRRR